ncbi:MAG: 4Fe-4S binding protein [Treponema sp.]|jgi:Fe-S-cluster-containing hydrogenase component 2|nr:4Fe-4S binding protein [Treponema sp.]
MSKVVEGVLYAGFPSKEELAACPGVATAERMAKGPVAVIECVQRIPCNPCVGACPFGAIAMPGDLTMLPELDEDRCTGCGSCIPQCPGLAIFVVNMHYNAEEASVDFPYEYLPLPEKGMEVDAVNRAGERVCSARVLGAQKKESNDGTVVIRLAVPREYAGEVRSMKLLPGKEL